MRRILSVLTHIPDRTTAEALIADLAALIVMALFVFSAVQGAAILGALVQAARLQ